MDAVLFLSLSLNNNKKKTCPHGEWRTKDPVSASGLDFRQELPVNPVQVKWLCACVGVYWGGGGLPSTLVSDGGRTRYGALGWGETTMNGLFSLICF